MTSKTVTCALAVLIAAASIGFAMTDSFARTRGAADPADLVNRLAPLNSCTIDEGYGRWTNCDQGGS